MSQAVEFAEKAAADRYREDHAEYICSMEDDKRQKTVYFVDDTPEWLIEQAEGEALAGQAEQEATGQKPLTDAERDRLNFSRDGNNVPKARAVKGIAQKHGVDDWLAYYDHTLTVDEHRSVMEQAAREGGGARQDTEQAHRERRGKQAERAAGERCDHALDHCQHGDPDACEFLTEACGFEDDEVSQLLSDDGASIEEEIDGKAAGALKRAWGGYQGAIADLADLLERFESEWRNAQQAARSINQIREAHGQDPIHFEKLEGAQAKLQDLHRTAAADCHECHSDHGGHEHSDSLGVDIARDELGNLEDPREGVVESDQKTANA